MLEEQINRIDKNVAVILDRQEHMIEMLNRHDAQIRTLEDAKYTIIGICIAVSSLLCLLTGYLFRG